MTSSFVSSLGVVVTKVVGVHGVLVCLDSGDTSAIWKRREACTLSLLSLDENKILRDGTSKNVDNVEVIFFLFSIKNDV